MRKTKNTTTTILVLLAILLIPSLATAFAPSTTDLRIDPTNPSTLETAGGYCTAIDGDGDDLYYSYAWYINGALVEGEVVAETSECSQEFANETTCNQLSTGTYEVGGSWDGSFTSANVIDGNYGTAGYMSLNSGIPAFVNITYEKPTGAVRELSYWYTEHDNLIGNNTLPSSCWNADPDKLYLRVESCYTSFNVAYRDHNPSRTCYDSWDLCWNSTDWEIVQSYIDISGDLRINDERMMWGINNTPVPQGVEQNLANLTLDIASPGDELTFSCLAYDGTTFNSWQNTSTTICEANWTCSSFDACTTNNTIDCNSVTDLNSCGYNYTGNYTEFQQSCTYTPVTSGGGGGGGSFPESSATAEEIETEETVEVIIVQGPSIWDRIKEFFSQLIDGRVNVTIIQEIFTENPGWAWGGIAGIATGAYALWNRFFKKGRKGKR